MNKSYLRIMLWALVLVASASFVYIVSKSIDGSNGTASVIDATVPKRYIKGSPDAPVRIVEFSDFECPACAAYHPLLKQLLAEFPDAVSLEYKHFPLPQHKNAKLAALVVEAAGVQGTFWEMHDTVFENQIDWAGNTKAALILAGYAEKLGLTMAQFNASLSDKNLKGIIEADYKEGLKAGVNSTPTFYVNGTRFANPRSYEELKQNILYVLENTR